MKGHLTSSPVGRDVRKAGSHDLGSPGGASSSTRTRFAVGALAHRRDERDTALTSVGAWAHTIVLTGALTHLTAHELEVEIEQRCADGVTAITLDLRELTYIDPIGVAVVAFRSRLCKRRGYEFAVVAGSPMMRRAFAQAGVGSLLDEVDEPDLGQIHSLALNDQARDSEA
jgi:anti-anti-sigma factor